jgi:hypothetical protein
MTKASSSEESIAEFEFQRRGANATKAKFDLTFVALI